MARRAPATVPELQAAYNAAHDALRQALIAQYPVGSVWLVYTRSGQKTASAMEVYGHKAGWCSLIEFKRERPPLKYGYRRWRPPFRCDVPLNQIVCLA